MCIADAERAVLQVIGSARDGGSSLAVPISYSFSGKAVGAELSMFAQHAEYRAAHRRRRAAAATVLSEPEPPAPADAEELTVSCGATLDASGSSSLHEPKYLNPRCSLRGEGIPAMSVLPVYLICLLSVYTAELRCRTAQRYRQWGLRAPSAGSVRHADGCTRGAGQGVERFTLLLNIADQPAWLKAVVLGFTLLEAPPLRPAACSGGPAPDRCASSVAGPSGSPPAVELSSGGAAGPAEQGDEQFPALSTGQAKRHRKQQGKKRSRLRQSKFGGTPRFARSPEAGAAGEGLSDSSPAVEPLADAQAAEGTPPVASCSGTVGGEPLQS